MQYYSLLYLASFYSSMIVGQCNSTRTKIPYNVTHGSIPHEHDHKFTILILLFSYDYNPYLFIFFVYNSCHIDMGHGCSDKRKTSHGSWLMHRLILIWSPFLFSFLIFNYISKYDYENSEITVFLTFKILWTRRWKIIKIF